MPAAIVSHLAVISIRTSDVLKTVHFYRDIVGLTHLDHHGHQPAFNLGNGLSLVIVEDQKTLSGVTPDPRFPGLAFAVADLDQAVAQLREHGVELPWGIESNLSSRWVEFFDPGGNLIEFAQFGA